MSRIYVLTPPACRARLKRLDYDFVPKYFTVQSSSVLSGTNL
jgi:hypothetical protein